MVETFEGTRLHYGDIIIIAVYFAVVLFVGLWTSRQNRGSATGYFLAGRNMHWIPIAASLFATNIGSLHIIGLAGSGAAAGMAIANYELCAMLAVECLALIFLPIYIASGIYTMPQYLQRRFGGKRLQILLSVLTLLMYIFIRLSTDLYAGSIIIEQAFSVDLYGAVILMLLIAATFTITGGLTAVIWTDFMQTIIMILGGLALMSISFYEVGGYSAMVEKYPYAVPNSTLHSNTTCGKPREDYMHLIRDPSSGDIPWPGILGLAINSVWYWSSDQVVVQRTLAAKNYSHAKAGALLVGFIKILPIFLMIFPGMIARILFTETVACADPDICLQVCGNREGCSNIAYPTLIIKLLPVGARGVMLAVMLAALMSSLTSIFNSSSTIFAMDVWTHIRKKASELEIMIVGRLCVIFLVVVSIIWLPIIKASQGTQLFIYVQEVSSFLQPPICAIFVLGVFWETLNEKGAFFSLLFGVAVGITRFAMQHAYTSPGCTSTEPDPTPALVKDFHHLYFSIFLFGLTTACAVVISLMTRSVDKRCLQRLTWHTRNSKEPRLDIDVYLRNRRSGSEIEAGEEELYELNSGMLKKTKGLANIELESLNEKDETDDVGSGDDDGTSGDTIDDITNHVDKPAEVDDKSSTFLPRRVLDWVCGVNSESKRQLASRQVEVMDMLSIELTPMAEGLTTIMAILLLSATVFLYGYFF